MYHRANVSPVTDHGMVRAIDPDEAFGILASEIRVEVLLALWEAEDHRATFSALREAVGMPDSGKFNYHIGQFEGRFVERTDDGYELTRAGIRLTAGLLAGTYTTAGDVGPIPVGEGCPICDGSMAFRYEEDLVRIDCETCGNVSRFPVPPGVFADDDPGQMPAVTDRYVRTEIDRTARGFCRDCDGRLDPRLATAAETVDGETDPPVDLADVPMVIDECRRCGSPTATNLGMRLVDHPAVVSFYHDHDVDYREIPVWHLAATTPDRTAVLDRDPIRARVTYRADGEQVSLTVDESLSVVDVDRSDE